MVFHDRPVYQEEHAAQLIMARTLHSPQKGRIHLRRSVDPIFAFPLQSDGGPYIFGSSACGAQLPKLGEREQQAERHKQNNQSYFGPVLWRQPPLALLIRKKLDSHE